MNPIEPKPQTPLTDAVFKPKKVVDCNGGDNFIYEYPGQSVDVYYDFARSLELKLQEAEEKAELYKAEWENGKDLLKEAERQRDEARQHISNRDKRLNDAGVVIHQRQVVIQNLQAERDQLIKVVDELAYTTRAGMGTHGEPCTYGDKCTLIVSCKKALTAYSLLPHVVQAKKGNKQ